MTDNEQCFMIALYGARLSSGELVPLVGEIADFFHIAGHSLSHLRVYGHGFGKRPLLFDRAWKRLRKARSEDIETVDALSFAEGGESTISDWTVTCAVDLPISYVHIGASLKVMPDAAQRIVAFIRRTLAHVRPAYGIGFVRKRIRGPSLYGLGIGYGRELPLSGPDYDESEAISRWGHTGMPDAVYARGIVRDVYPYNLLSACHLERDVGGGSLQSWIAADSRRGQLEAWGDGHVLWTVEPERAPAVRQALTGTGVLFADVD